MYDFGERLLEERKRLDLTQDEMAAAGGVAKGTYGNYEYGKRAPDADFLAKIVQAGADVQYILTGIRAQPALPEPTPEDPLARRRAMVKKLVDQVDGKTLDEVQAGLEKAEYVKSLEKRNFELERQLKRA